MTWIQHLAGAAGFGWLCLICAAPVVAEVAKELGILTVAVVTKPFPFEGKKRMSIAEEGLRALHEHVDSLITIPNERLLPVLPAGLAGNGQTSNGADDTTAGPAGGGAASVHHK